MRVRLTIITYRKPGEMGDSVNAGIGNLWGNNGCYYFEPSEFGSSLSMTNAKLSVVGQSQSVGQFTLFGLTTDAHSGNYVPATWNATPVPDQGAVEAAKQAQFPLPENAIQVANYSEVIATLPAPVADWFEGKFERDALKSDYRRFSVADAEDDAECALYLLVKKELERLGYVFGSQGSVILINAEE